MIYFFRKTLAKTATNSQDMSKLSRAYTSYYTIIIILCRVTSHPYWIETNVRRWWQCAECKCQRFWADCVIQIYIVADLDCFACVGVVCARFTCFWQVIKNTRVERYTVMIVTLLQQYPDIWFVDFGRQWAICSTRTNK